MPPFYFISYEWTTRDGRSMIENTVTDINPILWLSKALGSKNRYRIIFYAEINKFEYDTLKEQF